MFESSFSRHCFLPFQRNASLRSSLTFTSLHLLNSPGGSGRVWRCVSNGAAGAEGNVTLPARPIGTPPAIFTVAAVTPNGNRFRVRFGSFQRGGPISQKEDPPGTQFYASGNN
ncbi:hypothetical protein CDAR_376871 [Caerostris darwini]|uniref:Uncharacterized protein n=1 Tax=Caerostris darwini TaxID=1538125 RepID=A0AAV4SR80_9ARAC|nr:hypothetical protein CDAR_376871 [Caerostris darwini]